MLRQENPSDEHIADLIFQLSRLDCNGEFEPINTVHLEVACALKELQERQHVRFHIIFEHAVLRARLSGKKQQELLDSIETCDLL